VSWGVATIAAFRRHRIIAVAKAMGWGRERGGRSDGGGSYPQRSWRQKGETETSWGDSQGQRAGGKSKVKGKDGGMGSKPTDDPNFVQWSEGMRFDGSERGVSYVVEAYVASGTFSRVFRVRELFLGDAGSKASGGKRRWVSGDSVALLDNSALGSRVLAAKVMRRNDSYIQYTSDAQKEGALLQTLEKAQLRTGKPVLTMRCFDSFKTKDNAGAEYWCLILEWLDASLFDVVRANGNRGLHLSMVRLLLEQLFQQMRVLQECACTHTDIKHKNCCLADTEHFKYSGRVRDTLILSRPLAKFIDYGNAVFEGERKTHPIHTKQFRAPEVLLNVAQGWGPPSDTWTLGVTAAFLISGQLIFNSHDPGELVRAMVEALGPFPTGLLETAKDGRMRQVAEQAARRTHSPQLGAWVGLTGAGEATPEGRCLDLLRRMLAPDPLDRIEAGDALMHPFFVAGEPPVPERPEIAELMTLAGPNRDSAVKRLGGKKGKGKG